MAAVNDQSKAVIIYAPRHLRVCLSTESYTAYLSTGSLTSEVFLNWSSSILQPTVSALDQFRDESAYFIREPNGLISENLYLYPDNCSALSY